MSDDPKFERVGPLDPPPATSAPALMIELDHLLDDALRRSLNIGETRRLKTMKIKLGAAIKACTCATREDPR